eukprot:1095528-Rhodomonas_salina.1
MARLRTELHEVRPPYRATPVLPNARYCPRLHVRPQMASTEFSCCAATLLSCCYALPRRCPVLIY